MHFWQCCHAARTLGAIVGHHSHVDANLGAPLPCVRDMVMQHCSYRCLHHLQNLSATVGHHSHVDATWGRYSPHNLQYRCRGRNLPALRCKRGGTTPPLISATLGHHSHLQSSWHVAQGIALRRHLGAVRIEASLAECAADHLLMGLGTCACM